MSLALPSQTSLTARDHQPVAAPPPLASGAAPATPRVAVCFHRLGSYHAARLAAAADLFHVTAIEFSRTTETYGWDVVDVDAKVRRVTVSEAQDFRALPRRLRRLKMWAALDEARPNAVAVNGWSDGGALHALAWCLHNGVPAIVMSETNRRDALRRPWREWVKRRITSCFASALAGGESHAAYLAELGLPREACALGYDVVDNRHFQRQPAANDCESPSPDGILRPRRFLASARFVPQKNLDALVRAFADYRRRAGDGAWALTLLGDGPLRPQIERLCADLGVDAHVQLPGFRQYDELPAYYAGAQVFIHASAVEPWGLVVNEAMAAGMPVLVSQNCGCAAELVRVGVNGFLFDPSDSSALAQRMHELAHGGVDLNRLGRASQEIAAAWGPERFAQGLAAAVELALREPTRRPGRFARVVVNMLARR